ncbi:acetylcholinesterase precursor [Teratosphaeria destructans]|uniref:Carboxylic ester hydrolase n=1 Tax=Teratosphaeria destructans TaxID=418781 RepID=A0A9W7T1P4_9PEZI|nr:acetylcholinesterase precursor [Teratosphaeria destructans]
MVTSLRQSTGEMKATTGTAALAGALSGFVASTSAFQIGQAVQITSGTVIGHPATDAPQVGEYLGIPYAQPPLGNLRFAPPQPYRSDRTISASSHGHNCPSRSAAVPSGALPPTVYNLLADLGQVGDQQNEDCLYINVWNKPQSGAVNKPVLVWIHGGGFNLGGTNGSAYGGQFIVDTEDVVLVNFNYRLNIFGFPGAYDMDKNVGLLDQRLAIEWVRDNIAAFGGDPKRITLFGQSAGGGSVEYFNYAWTQDPIIAGSIALSGSATAYGNLLPATANSRWISVASRAGCTQKTPDAVLACMRSVSMETLITAEFQSRNGTNALQGNFGPTIDDKVVFTDYNTLAQKNLFIQRPTIYGNTIYEAGFFALLLAGLGQTRTPEYWTQFDARGFTCPATTAAIYRSNGANLPTWRYVYHPVFPNIHLPTDNNLAWHGAELLPLFGTDEIITKGPSTAQERAMGKYLRGAFAAFAADPVAGLTKYGWKRYDNASETVVQLGFDDPSSANFCPGPTYNTTVAYYGGCAPFPDPGQPNK